MSSEPDPIELAVKSVAKAAIEHFEEKIEGFIERFKRGELAFIEDKGTIEVVKKQREKPSWKLYRKYVSDSDIRLQIEMGLSLRAFEKEKNHEKLDNLRRIIRDKFGTRGLHVAQLSQNGLIDKYLWLLFEKTTNETELKEGISESLKNIDKYVGFIKAEENIEHTGRRIVTQIDAHNPRGIILLGIGKKAEENAREIIDYIKTRIEGYRIEIQSEPEDDKSYYFIIRNDVEPT